MGILKNFLDSRTVRNAVQQKNGFENYSNTSSLYTRDITKYFDGVNRSGKYDNYYGDYNRIITVAPTFPLYYVDKDNEVVEDSEFVKHLETPNEDYPQYKVLQQIYSEMITKGYSEVFLWRKEGEDETKLFKEGKIYPEDNFRGITLVSGYDPARLTRAEKENIIRIQYGVSQENVFLGYSPTQAAQAWRKMQDEMGLHMTAFARNAGVPIGQFIITASSPEEFVAMREKLEGKIAGAKNNGKALFSYRPADVSQAQIEWVQFSSQDVQDYTSQLEFSEKKMSQSFGVPGTIKGTNDKENYATARVSEQVFIKYTIKPLIEDFKAQLSHAIEKRFELSGEIKVNVVIPEIADESLVKIRATQEQIKLFDQKIAEGYTAESVVMAFGLPDSFLLLQTDSDAKKAQNKPKKAHRHLNKTELVRRYQNSLSEKDKDELEREFRKVTTEYADLILEKGAFEQNRVDYEGSMSVVFSDQYTKLYDKALSDVADALVEALGAVDASELDLTEEELEEAVKQYRKRVDDFSKTFTEAVDKMPGTTLEVRRAAAQPNIDRVVVTESEHTRIVSELQGWTKAQEAFPVRVIKKWNTLPGACKECAELENTEIDVTALFVNSGRVDEIYEVQGGGLHPNCRCYVTYVVSGEDVRKFDGDE